jgi:uncharacterized SAM-binding protein YcdF (DUF218 family)
MMSYVLHKLLPVFFLPTGWLIILLVCAGVSRKRRYVAASLVVLLLSSNAMVADGLVTFANGHTIHQQSRDMPLADAIVVLGEGREWAPGGVSEWTDSDRFWGGIDLYEAQRAPILIFTGGTAPNLPNDPLEGRVLAQYAQRLGVPRSHILVGDRAFTTEEEARSIASVARANGSMKRILLVTSAYHMRRAHSLFEHQGFEVIDYPVDFKVQSSRTHSIEDFLPMAKYFKQTEMIIRELEGRLFYFIFNF